MKKMLVLRLILELLVIVLVSVIFKAIADRLTAGIVAGTVFIFLGFYVVYPGFQSAEFRRTKVFWAGCAHLVFSALPLFITRALNAGSAFSEVKVLGLPGPIFHRFSTCLYMVMLIANIFDLIQLILRERRKAH